MGWDEFKALLSGLDNKTPLGKIIAIRSENDQNTLKHFSKDQHRIRNGYRNKIMYKVSDENYQTSMQQFKNMFLSMAGKKYEKNKMSKL